MNKLKPNEIINEVTAVLKENYNLKTENKKLKEKIADLKEQNGLLESRHRMLVHNNFMRDGGVCI